MSRIVKAKWVVHSPHKNSLAEEIERLEKPAPEKFEDGLSEDNLEVEIDHQLEAIRMANDLMKSALRSSREISEKSQEDGFDKGYNEGYQLGYETGFPEGVRAGIKKAQVGVEEALGELGQLAGEIRLSKEEEVLKRKDEIIDLALEIAKKIMRFEINKDQEEFLNIFHEVIHQDDQNVKIYLSEYQKTLDLRLKKSTIEKLKKLSQKMKVVLLEEEDKIVVETDQAVIDMAVPVQIEEIKRAVADNQ